MSPSYHAVVVVGVPVRGLFRPSVALRCGHPPVPGKFCPECGKIQRPWVDPNEGFEPLAAGVNGGKFYDLGAVALDHTSWDPEGIWFIGKVLTTLSTCMLVQPEVMHMPNKEGLFARLREVLEPLDKWEPDKFGIWCFLREDWDKDMEEAGGC